jgi:hypothetical protein
MGKVIIFIYLYTEVMKLVGRQNTIITAKLVKDVINHPKEMEMDNDNFEFAVQLYSTYPHLYGIPNEEWAKYFKVFYIYESAYWEDGDYIFNADH